VKSYSTASPKKWEIKSRMQSFPELESEFLQTSKKNRCFLCFWEERLVIHALKMYAKTKKHICNWCGRVSKSAALYSQHEQLARHPASNFASAANPNAHHFQNAMLAVGAAKRVLCEETFTMK
jgi:hypothetical protein